MLVLRSIAAKLLFGISKIVRFVTLDISTDVISLAGAKNCVVNAKSSLEVIVIVITPFPAFAVKSNVGLSPLPDILIPGPVACQSRERPPIFKKVTIQFGSLEVVVIVAVC